MLPRVPTRLPPTQCSKQHTCKPAPSEVFHSFHISTAHRKMRRIQPEQINLVAYCFEQQWAEFTPQEAEDARQVLQLLTDLEMQQREANK